MEGHRAEARRRSEQRAGIAAAAAPRGGAADGAAASAAAPPGAGAGFAKELLEQLWRQWETLSLEQRRQALAGIAVVLAVLLMGGQAVPLLAAIAIAFYLHLRLPQVDTFDPFFKIWFTREYFPKVSQKLQRELQKRAQKQENLLDSLACQFKGWVMGKTEKLQASVWYEFAVKQALPPVYAELLILRTATVNLGSSRQPCHITFWGFHQSWMPAPFTQIDVENVSLLDEFAKQRQRVSLLGEFEKQMQRTPS